MEKTVNAIGEVCPIPVVMTKKAIKELGGEGRLKTLVDNETAVENLKKLAAQKGFEVEVKKADDGNFEVCFDISAKAYAAFSEGKAEDEHYECAPSYKKKKVVVIGSDKMGAGDDELGAILIKGFIFAISEQEELPDTILFYNGGAKLTCEGSESLEDIKNLEKAGVSIMTCGTCLNHYGLSEKLAVGSVTNMYVIAETMTGADLIIKP